MQRPNEKEVVLVTGGASAVGAACVEHLTRVGYEVFSMEKMPYSSASGKGPAAGGQEAAFVVGVANRAGGVHVLVNCETQVLTGAVENTEVEEARLHFERSYFSPLRAVKAALPFMRVQGAGLIVNVLTADAEASSAFFSQYAAGRCAVRASSEALRREVAPFGIGVALVEAGGFPAESRFVEAQEARTSGLYWDRYKQALRGARAPGGGAPPQALAHQVRRVIERAAPRKRIEQGEERPLRNRVIRQVTPAGRQSVFLRRGGRVQGERSSEESLVRFRGSWGEDEQRLVEAAVSEWEIKCQLEACAEYAAERWLCSVHEVPEGGLVYTANRPGLGRVLTAETAGSLAEKITGSRATRVW